MSQSGQPRERKQRLLSREQQAIWKRDNRASLKGKPKEEKKAAREKMRSQLQAMSEGDRAKFAKDLQAKWDALPESERQELKKKAKAGAGKRRRDKAGAGDDDDD